MKMFTIIMVFINSFPLRANIFILTSELIKLYDKAISDKWCYKFLREASDAFVITWSSTKMCDVQEISL